MHPQPSLPFLQSEVAEMTSLPLTKEWYAMTHTEFVNTALAHSTLRIKTKARRGRPATYLVRGPEHLEAIVPQRPLDCVPLSSEELKLAAIEGGHWHELILAKAIRSGIISPPSILDEYPHLRQRVREQRSRFLWQYIDRGDTVLAAEESAWKGGAQTVVSTWRDQRSFETAPSWKVSVGRRTEDNHDARIVFFEKEKQAENFATHARAVAEISAWQWKVQCAELQSVAVDLAQDELFQRAVQYGEEYVPAFLKEQAEEVRRAMLTAQQKVALTRKGRPILPQLRVALLQLSAAMKSGDEIVQGAARADYAEARKLDGASCSYPTPVASLPEFPDLTPGPERLSSDQLGRLEQALFHAGPTPGQWDAATADREQMARFGLPNVYWIAGTPLAGTGFRLERRGNFLYTADRLAAEEVARHELVPLGPARGQLLVEFWNHKYADDRVELFRNADLGQWDAWVWWQDAPNHPGTSTAYHLTAAGLVKQASGLAGEDLWADIADRFDAGYRMISQATMQSLTVLPTFIAGATGVPLYARPTADVIEHLRSSGFPFYFPDLHRVCSLSEWLAEGGEVREHPLGLRFLWNGRSQPYAPVHEPFGQLPSLSERAARLKHLLNQFQNLRLPVPHCLIAFDREVAEACRLSDIPYLAPVVREPQTEDVLVEPGRFDSWRMTAEQWISHCENLGQPSQVYLKGRDDQSLAPEGITFTPVNDAAVQATAHYRNGQSDSATAADIASVGDRPFIDGTANVGRKYLIGWLYGQLAHPSDDYRKVHRLRVMNALRHGQYHAAIALGDLTVERAAQILRSAGVAVPPEFNPGDPVPVAEAAR